MSLVTRTSPFKVKRKNEVFLLFETLRERVLLPLGEGQMSKIGHDFPGFWFTLKGLVLVTILLQKLTQKLNSWAKYQKVVTGGLSG